MFLKLLLLNLLLGGEGIISVRLMMYKPIYVGLLCVVTLLKQHLQPENPFQ